MNLFNHVYEGKNVLVTGHTGFKGSWLCIWLLKLGANVIGYSLDPLTTKDNFVVSQLSTKLIDIRGDIRDRDHLNQVFEEYKPEIVFHLAAQPLVRYSYLMPLETYDVNLMGTIHVLEAMRQSQYAKIGIFITTDKCYENKEQLWGYRENDPFGGYDPYSSSKGACEIAINSWRQSFFNPHDYHKHGKSIASVRAGNVIGGGDWSVDRLLPDCIRALENQASISIRNPNSVRPWQFVLEPLYGYLLLGEKLMQNPTRYCEGYNFGPKFDSMTTVGEMTKKVIESFGRGGMIDCSEKDAVHEANLLMLDITKAYFELGWQPKLSMDQTITFTTDWYKAYHLGNMFDFCLNQITKYETM